MGKFDSSKTRVVPVFDELKRRDPIGGGWLQKLLALPRGSSAASVRIDPTQGIQHSGWGKDEVGLDPPVALLSWLLRHPRQPCSGGLSKDAGRAAKRQQWLTGAKETIGEGLALLRNNPKGERWHIFEGTTKPDVYIETAEVIVVIEGKRTEEIPTIGTKWMAGRHQMLRHIDDAWEIRGNKRVVGFFIVEGAEQDGQVPPEWLTFAQQTTSPDAISGSLPHRSSEEQAAIAECFIGVTTWQIVCTTFGIEWGSLPDAV